MRKNIFRTVAAAAVMASVMTVPAFAESGTVTGSHVNIRSGPGTNYGVVDCLPKGAQLTVTDRSNSSWYAVEYMGSSGFMSSAYVAVTEEEVPVETPAYGSSSGGSEAYINAMYVRFRSGPGSEYSILGEYNKGKAVTLSGTYGEWSACTIDGRDGYIYSSYINQGSYSAPSYSYSGDIYLDNYIPDLDDEYLVTPPPERPVPSPTPRPWWEDEVEVTTPPATPAPTEKPVETPKPTEVPVATPGPTEVPVATPAPTEVPVATPAPSPVPSPSETESGTRARGFINANYVRFRTGPSTGYSIIDTYNRGTALVINGSADDWTACEINGIFGYVFSQYVTETVSAEAPVPGTPVPVQTPEPTAESVPVTTPEPSPTPVVNVEQKPGYVTGNTVRMRGGPSMTSEILTELNYGNKVIIVGVSGDWTAVTYEGRPGFIYSQYVAEGEYSIPVQPEAPGGDSELSGSELGRQIANYALQFVGYNYSWGGKSPDTGFDCSGLVYYVYQQFGFTLNRVAQDQALNGVHADDLQPGDVLCFYSGSSYIGHSGIYIGDGKFVHAANSATGVIVSSLSGYYDSRGYEIRRIV